MLKPLQSKRTLGIVAEDAEDAVVFGFEVFADFVELATVSTGGSFFFGAAAITVRMSADGVSAFVSLSLTCAREVFSYR